MRLLKPLLGGTAVVLFIAGGLLFSADMYVDQKLNSYAAPVNSDAEFPEAAFERLYSRDDMEPLTESGNLKDVEGSRLEKRFRVGEYGRRDFIRSRKYLTPSYGLNTTAPRLFGYRFSNCRGAVDDRYFCGHGSRYSDPFTLSYLLELEALTYTGQLDRFLENKSRVRRTEAFIRRADFYDSYLDPEGFELKSVEGIYYTPEAGLVVVGTTDEVRIDGEVFDLEDGRVLHHVDVELGPGSHSVETGDMSLELPVYRLPERDSFGNRTVLTPSGDGFFFDSVTFRTGYGNYTAELEGKKTELQVPGEPEAVFYSREGFELVMRSGDGGTERPMEGEMYGMTPEEYRKFRRKKKRFQGLAEVLPLVDVVEAPDT